MSLGIETLKGRWFSRVEVVVYATVLSADAAYAECPLSRPTEV
jgi:hypothetical protein